MKIINKFKVFIKDNLVLETKLARLYSHTKDSFFILSAFRSEKPLETNLYNTEQLKQDLKFYDLGYIELYGYWIENMKTPDETSVEEISEFVPYNPNIEISREEFIQIGIDLAVKYNQEALIIKRNANSPILVYYPLSGKKEVIGEFSPDKMAQAYSKIRYGKHQNRTFVFEGYRVPSNHISAIGMIKQGYIF